MTTALPIATDTPTPHQAGLDTLRALAALCVLFAHGGYFLYAAVPSYDTYAFAGVLGTDLFFALAGFLLATQLLARPPRTLRDVARWWAWRGWRVLPLFWAALLLHLAIAAWLQASPGFEALAFAALLQNLAWLHPAFFGEAWNLPVLVLFFLLAPPLAACCARAPDSARRFAWLLIAWLLLGIALRIGWVLATDLSWDSGVRKIVLARGDACVYGALAACIVLRMRDRSPRAAWPLAIVPWIAAAAAFTLLPRDTSDLAKIGVFVLIGLAGACTVAAASIPAANRPARPLAALARWSYPLYLLNMPVLLLMTGLGVGQQADAGIAILRFVLWLAVSIALAALVHRVCEAPLIAARARRLARPAASTAARAASSR